MPTQTGITPPDDTLQTTNPPGINGGLANSIPSATLPPAPTAPSYTSTPATATGYTATPYAVPKEGTVQEQVKSIIGEDSALMQQARQKATQEMNARGLVNSSIAVGAGQQAVIAQALPIAQQDAQTYTNAATNTANQQNAASQFTAGAQNTVGLANAQQQNAALANNQQAAVQLINTRMQQEAQVALANLDTQTRMQLSTMDTQTRQLLQTNQSASNAYVQAVTNISNISNSNTMSQEAKDRAVQTQLNLLNEQLRTIGTLATTTPAEISELNLGSFFQSSSEAVGNAPITTSTGTPVGAPNATGLSSLPPTPPPAAPTAPTYAAGQLSSGPYAGHPGQVYAQYPNSGVAYVSDLGGWTNGIHQTMFPSAEAAMSSLG